MNELKWTDEQHRIVRDLIAEEVEKARLSHKFIPELKLAEDARSVPADKYDAESNSVDDVSTIPLVEVAAAVNLTKLQAEDSDLSAALLLIRRAANRMARAHDAIVFSGQPEPGRLPETAPKAVTASGGYKNDGAAAANPEIEVKRANEGQQADKAASYGEELVKAVAEALVKLEGKGYIGSYVLVLGQKLFTEANTPSPGSLVLPKDRLEALLGGGHVHRSSVLKQDVGLLISMGGEPMDRAVAVEPRFEFLRIGPNEVRECRVFERFAFRLKEGDSIIKLVRK